MQCPAPWQRLLHEMPAGQSVESATAAAAGPRQRDQRLRVEVIAREVREHGEQPPAGEADARPGPLDEEAQLGKILLVRDRRHPGDAAADQPIAERAGRDRPARDQRVADAGEDRVDLAASRGDGRHGRECDQRGQKRVLQHVLPGVIANESAHTVDDESHVSLSPPARRSDAPMTLRIRAAHHARPRRRGLIRQLVCPGLKSGNRKSRKCRNRGCLLVVRRRCSPAAELPRSSTTEPPNRPGGGPQRGWP